MFSARSFLLAESRTKVNTLIDSLRPPNPTTNMESEKLEILRGYNVTKSKTSFVFLSLLVARGPISGVGESPRCNHRFIHQTTYNERSENGDEPISETLMKEGEGFQNTPLSIVFYCQSIKTDEEKNDKNCPEIVSISQVDYQNPIGTSSFETCTVHTNLKADWLNEREYLRFAKLFGPPQRKKTT